ncbi:hypothetical protein L6J37_17175 [Photobacterium sp. WH77]|uniref:hypothetical protein n=1 Tax=unclassified Photobacterium TaxID=2628852 RepID=UPI001C4445FD|nr:MULTISPECIES: hypothetical protein [unclassified Photobacterium]MBV7260907.1 hypothetical protein [Photobacterium sp. WH24]MCG2838568.1 hypothetical protein [Photobacterium sp. WH77]MCG2846211.1 hypothetical protein [Photobacterium sp. WH80]
MEVDFEQSSSQIATDRFSIEGTAQYVNGSLSVNGVELLMSSMVHLDDGLTKASSDGQWVELECYFDGSAGSQCRLDD